MKSAFRKIVALLLCIASFVGLFSGCSGTQAQPDTVPTETTVATEPPATVPDDGDPGDVTCKGSYTASLAAEGEKTVAQMGDAVLTNSQLQLWYWLTVNSYRLAGYEENPDYNTPLDTQSCGIDSSVNSWQQYFLREALETWAAAQALDLQSAALPLESEEAYKPNEKIHAMYFSQDYPASRVYYGTTRNYTPNELHRAYLDEIPAMLSCLAEEKGFSDCAGLASALAGDSQTLAQTATLYNRSYMYFTELTYSVEVTDEAAQEYYSQHRAEYAQAGITPESGKYVDMRHILLIPEGATLSENGTVTATEEAWQDCERSAREILDTYIRNVSAATYYDPTPSTYGNFAELAVAHSQDSGSASNGGLYQSLTKGQLAAPLDQWLFDESRVQDETAIIRSDAGVHIIFFAGSRDIYLARAKSDLTQRLYQDMISAALEANPVTVDYSAICLNENGKMVNISFDELLYSDIAHERFPSAPLYLQMDYPDTYYGEYPLSSHGCGICSLAMLATYLTDTELTPAALCELFGLYCGPTGSNRQLFVVAPSELGVYLKATVVYDDEAYEWLQQGYPVACIQRKGYFTSGGHFIFLEKMNDDGTIQVRDSDIKNYSKLSGNSIDAHEWYTVTAGAACYWVYEKKVTNCSACLRCADGTVPGAPEVLFAEDYLCAKCTAALARRDIYLGYRQ